MTLLLVLLGGCSYLLESPPPSADEVAPDVVCNDQRSTVVTLRGAAFTPLPVDVLQEQEGLVLPEIYLRRVSDLDGTEVQGEPVDVGDLTRWLDDGTMEFDVTPDLGLAPGVYDVGATNPDGQRSVASAVLAVVPPPSLDSISPSLESVVQAAQTVTLSGSGFLEGADGTRPTVAVGSFSGTPTSMDGCTDNVEPAGGRTCTGLTLELPVDAEVPDVHDVVVTNPTPADCASDELVQIELVPAPEILSVDPSGTCTDATEPVRLQVSGSGFLDLADAGPVLRVGPTELGPLTLDACAPLELGGGSTCDVITADLPVGTFSTPGDYAVVVENPETAEAVSDSDVIFTVSPPPVLTGVEPNPICEGGELTLFGEGLSAAVTVRIGGVEATIVEVIDGGLVVQVPEGLGAGFKDVTVEAPGGCSDTLEDVVEVVNVPIIVFVDPPVAYNGISLEATVYVSGIHGDVTDAWVIHADTGARTDVDYTYDPSEPSRLKVVLPDGLPEGDYQVVLTDEALCESGLDEAFVSEADLTVDLDSVEPEYAWTDAFTPITLFAADPPGMGLVQFQDVPRVYLNPAGASTTATELYSISFEDVTQLDAIVPDGLDVGTYDLIVTNPDGSIGLLESALEITADPPPSVEAISPLTADSNSDTSLTITGSDFDDPSVSFDCVSTSSGTATTASGTVTAWSAERITVTMPSSSLSGNVCVVVVENTGGPYTSFASVSVTPPSDNLSGWNSGSTLTTARRAPAAVAARSTRSSRYLYVLGGDDGSAAGALSGIERARVDNYGELGSFTAFDRELPAARTLSSVQAIGRFIYLVGGNTGSAPTDTVWRAQVLDPLETPRVDDISVEFGDGTNLGGGTWVYRVAALYDGSYATNPGGESLAGDPFVVRLPETDDTLTVTLSWTRVDNASGYRIYRTPVADSGSGTEERVADVSGGGTLSWTDTGATADPTQTPLPRGSLGEWYAVTSMSDAREAPCTAVGRDPTDPSKAYLYVAGGVDGSGLPRRDIVYLDISLVDDQTQNIGSWASAGQTLASGVSQCGGYSATSALHPAVPSGETWIYFAGGLGESSTTGATAGGQVSSGGTLSSWTIGETMRPDRGGFGFAAASDYLYVFGGQKGRPSDTGHSATLNSPTDLDNWNSLGISMSEPRYLPGSAQESSVIFVIGGSTDTSDATDTVDWTNY